ncbi:hypothetical protein U27_01986 [Candidatus Vecturithrix granuli]|uniref:Uncharacterized protein n=1 Tax=Vecturithrix granuli TaxID=1499967 RepID=A0A0S6WAK5_VECG1|nr:hypothetical protein U27_01986 [Candidatus Vecturithrix granuli]
MNTDFTASFAKDLRNLRDQRILKHIQRVIHAIENARDACRSQTSQKIAGHGELLSYHGRRLSGRFHC